MVIGFVPKNLGLWDPFQMAIKNSFLMASWQMKGFGNDSSEGEPKESKSCFNMCWIQTLYITYT